MKLISQHDMGGFGGMGEGMGMQKTKDGRRVMWLGHEGPPKNFTAIDVTDPKNPKMIIQTELPHAKMRSNSLEVFGDKMYVAHQIRGEFGMTPAGVRYLGHQHARAAEEDLAFRCVRAALAGRALHLDGGRRVPAHLLGRRRLPAAQLQGLPVLPHHRHPQPCQAGRGRPLVASGPEGGRRGAGAAAPSEVRQRLPPAQHPGLPAAAGPGLRLRTSTAASSILDISDKSKPKAISHFNYSPPYNGFTHTAMPLF